MTGALLGRLGVGGAEAEGLEEAPVAAGPDLDLAVVVGAGDDVGPEALVLGLVLVVVEEVDARDWLVAVREPSVDALGHARPVCVCVRVLTEKEILFFVPPKVVCAHPNVICCT